MDIQNEILQLRWAMLTNPFAMPVPPMCRHTEIEIIEHGFLLDEITTGKQLSKAELDKHRARFRRFCKIQWYCRDRN